jgi:hypothetical protein
VGTEASPSRVRVTRSTPDGVVTFVRDGRRVTFRLAYRDPFQSCPVSKPSPECITWDIDTLRDDAVAAMRRIVGELMDHLLTLLAPGGGTTDFIDPSFHSRALPPRTTFANGTVSIRLAPFYVTLTDSDAGESSDRFLAKEYARAVVRQRVQNLWLCYEEARRDVLDELQSADS